MTRVIDRWKNPGRDTFNGIKMLAELSGLSEAEVRWTADRLKQMMHVEGRSKDEAKRIVAEEAAGRPWESS